MIRLITGLPGHGKTLYLIEQIFEVNKSGDRRIYVAGISSLDVSRFPHPELIELVDYSFVENWKTDVVDGALIVVDEVQELMPQRSKGSAAAFITDLSTHRHSGLDFWFVTQDPRLIDAWARRLVGEHSHVKRLFGSSFCVVFSYDHSCDNPRDPVEKRHARKSYRRLNSRFFDFYKSASVHTVKRRVPVSVVGAFVFFPSLLVGGYLAVSSSNLLSGEAPVLPGSDHRSSAGGSVGVSGVMSSGSGNHSRPGQRSVTEAVSFDGVPVVSCRRVGNVGDVSLYELTFADGKTLQLTYQLSLVYGDPCGGRHVWSGYAPSGSRGLGPGGRVVLNSDSGVSGALFSMQ